MFPCSCSFSGLFRLTFNGFVLLSVAWFGLLVGMLNGLRLKGLTVVNCLLKLFVKGVKSVKGLLIRLFVKSVYFLAVVCGLSVGLSVWGVWCGVVSLVFLLLLSVCSLGGCYA